MRVVGWKWWRDELVAREFERVNCFLFSRLFTCAASQVCRAVTLHLESKDPLTYKRRVSVSKAAAFRLQRD